MFYGEVQAWFRLRNLKWDGGGGGGGESIYDVIVSSLSCVCVRVCVLWIAMLIGPMQTLTAHNSSLTK